MLTRRRTLCSAASLWRRSVARSSRRGWTSSDGRRTSDRWWGEFSQLVAMASLSSVSSLCCFSERYRDLIDAADSIVDMKDCSEKVRSLSPLFCACYVTALHCLCHNFDRLCHCFVTQVVHSVGAMEQLCQSLQQTHFLRGSGGMRGPSIKR